MIFNSVVILHYWIKLEAAFNKIDRQEFDKSLQHLSKKLNMEIKIHYQEPNRSRNIAILISKEKHCLQKILDAKKTGEIKANLSVIIGTENTLAHMAKSSRMPHYV